MDRIEKKLLVRVGITVYLSNSSLLLELAIQAWNQDISLESATVFRYQFVDPVLD